jgi:hypothetical protein
MFNLDMFPELAVLDHRNQRAGNTIVQGDFVVHSIVHPNGDDIADLQLVPAMAAFVRRLLLACSPLAGL